MCGEPGTQDALAKFYTVRFEAGARVTTWKRAGVVLCDACAAHVRRHWRTRRLAGVALLGAIFGSLFGALAIMSIWPDLPIPVRAILVIATLAFVLVPTILASSWLRDHRRDLHDRLAERWDLDPIYDRIEAATGPARGVTFELELVAPSAVDPPLASIAHRVVKRRGRS